MEVIKCQKEAAAVHAVEAEGYQERKAGSDASVRFKLDRGSGPPVKIVTG